MPTTVSGAGSEDTGATIADSALDKMKLRLVPIEVVRKPFAHSFAILHNRQDTRHENAAAGLWKVRHWPIAEM